MHSSLLCRATVLDVCLAPAADTCSLHFDPIAPGLAGPVLHVPLARVVGEGLRPGSKVWLTFRHGLPYIESPEAGAEVRHAS